MNAKSDYPHLGRYTTEDARVRGDVYYAPTAGYPAMKSLTSFGPPGSGKSTALAGNAFAYLMRSIISTDFKAQGAMVYAAYRARNFGPTYVFNPEGMFDEHAFMRSRRYNAITQLGDPKKRGFEKRAAKLAETLIPAEPDGRGAFFTAGARLLWRIGAMYFRLVHGPGATLHDVRTWLNMPTQWTTDAGGRRTLSSGFLYTLSAMATCGHPAIEGDAARIGERLTNLQAHTTSAEDTRDTALRYTEWVSEEPYRRDAETSEMFDWTELRRKIATVFLVVPILQVNSSPWLRIVLADAINALYDEASLLANPRSPPILFLLDEAGSLNYMPELPSLLITGRDHKLAAWTLWQSLAQIKQSYPGAGWNLFFTGAGVVTTYACRDLETAEHFSRWLGRKTENVVSASSASNPKTTVPNLSVGPQSFEFMRPERLMALPANRMIVSMEGIEHPFMTTTAPYSLGRGFGKNPYYPGR